MPSSFRMDALLRCRWAFRALLVLAAPTLAACGGGEPLVTVGASRGPLYVYAASTPPLRAEVHMYVSTFAALKMELEDMGVPVIDGVCKVAPYQDRADTSSSFDPPEAWIVFTVHESDVAKAKLVGLTPVNSQQWSDIDCGLI